MQMIALPLLQPMADQCCFVGSVIIQQPDGCREINWNSAVYLLQEVEKLHRTVAPVALAKYAASGDIESCEEGW